MQVRSTKRCSCGITTPSDEGSTGPSTVNALPPYRTISGSLGTVVLLEELPSRLTTTASVARDIDRVEPRGIEPLTFWLPGGKAREAATPGNPHGYRVRGLFPWHGHNRELGRNRGDSVGFGHKEKLCAQCARDPGGSSLSRSDRESAQVPTCRRGCAVADTGFGTGLAGTRVGAGGGSVLTRLGQERLLTTGLATDRSRRAIDPIVSYRTR